MPVWSAINLLLAVLDDFVILLIYINPPAMCYFYSSVSGLAPWTLTPAPRMEIILAVLSQILESSTFLYKQFVPKTQ